MIQELKAFLLRGDVVTLAVAVIIGEAFGKIVSSLVNDIISPVLGILSGGVDFSKQKLTLSGEAALGWGNFVQTIINFVLVGVVLFFVVKAAGKKAEDVK